MSGKKEQGEPNAKTPLLRAVSKHGGGADQEVIPFLDSPSYTVLLQTGLLTALYRKPDLESLDLMPANTTLGSNFKKRWFYCLLFPCIGGCIYDCLHATFFVPSGHAQRLVNGDGEYFLAGPGYHRIYGPWWSLEGEPVNLARGVSHGDRTIAVVEQGSVGLAWDLGQPLLLPPGVHEWRSQTLTFEKCIRLDDPVIRIGPYTLVTVDSGYAAITLNNGNLTILPGGKNNSVSAVGGHLLAVGLDLWCEISCGTAVAPSITSH